MGKEYYALATGKKGETFGLHYDAYGIITYHNLVSAEEKLEELCRKNKLEGKIINFTFLVETGLVAREKIRIQD